MAKLVKASEVREEQSAARKARRHPKKKDKNAVRHDIFLLDTHQLERFDDRIDRVLKTDQIVNVYEHTSEDFERNAFRIIKHFETHLGDSRGRISNIGQYIKYRVTKNGPVFQQMLFFFFHNYLMLKPLVLFGADLSTWTPWEPAHFSNSMWVNTMDTYVAQIRDHCTADEMSATIGEIKHPINQFAYRVGDILGLSISYNEIIECMKRSKEARKIIECRDIPENPAPNELEGIITKRTNKILNFMSEQKDLSLSTLAGNGLFNAIQAREFFVHIGYKPTLAGATLPFTSNTNALMGWKDPLAHYSNAIGGRKAETLKLNVSTAGDFERSLSALLSPVRYADPNYECDSHHYRVRHIDSRETLMNLEGRIFTLDPDSDVYTIVDPYDPTQHLIGKTIYLKTPITCTHPRRSEGVICSACYGKLLTSVNQAYHIGRITALKCSDKLEQTLLSAKHANRTDTFEVEFSASFAEFFEDDHTQIRFNKNFIDAVLSDPQQFEGYYFEFNLSTIKKRKDGENRNFDRSVTELVIYNANTDERVIVNETHSLDIYFSPAFNDEYFLPAARKATTDVVAISIADIINNDCVHLDGENSFLLFEYQFRNHELSDSLMTLTGILFNGTKIDQYTEYNNCLDDIIPLFIGGGIHIPEVHIELLLGQLIKTEDMHAVDWNDPDPAYKLYSVNKSILTDNSIITSLLFRESTYQLKGRYGTYEKTGTGMSDIFLADEDIREVE